MNFHPPCYSPKKCPTENGLTKDGKLPPDPDACNTCYHAPWNLEFSDEEEKEASR